MTDRLSEKLNMEMLTDALVGASAGIGTNSADIEVSATVETMLSYLDEILDANEQVNMTAITDRDEAIAKHLIDSLACAGLESFESAETVIDVGSGGGFPGVPLAIAFPEKKFVLLDSLKKRMDIVAAICESLVITNVQTIHGRAEDLARGELHRDAYDFCVSRAVANMRVLAELCLPFVKPGGSFVANKGPDCEEEVAAAAKAIELLGGELVGIVGEETSAAEISGHRLVVVKKVGPTPDRFPRRAGKPAKAPL